MDIKSVETTVLRYGTLGEGTFGKVYSTLSKVIAKDGSYKTHVTAEKKFRRKADYIKEKSINMFILDAIRTKKTVINNFAVMLYYVDKDLKIGLELVEGNTLHHFCADYCKTYGHLSVSFLTYLVNNVIKSVDALHSIGLIHNDIKVDNILVSRKFEFKIIDFSLSSKINTTNLPLARAQYLPPETTIRYLSQPSIDVYSIGILILDLVEGSCVDHSAPNGSVPLSYIENTIKRKINATSVEEADVLSKIQQFIVECTDIISIRRPNIKNLEFKLTRAKQFKPFVIESSIVVGNLMKNHILAEQRKQAVEEKSEKRNQEINELKKIIEEKDLENSTLEDELSRALVKVEELKQKCLNLRRENNQEQEDEDDNSQLIQADSDLWPKIKGYEAEIIWKRTRMNTRGLSMFNSCFLTLRNQHSKVNQEKHERFVCRLKGHKCKSEIVLNGIQNNKYKPIKIVYNGKKLL